MKTETDKIAHWDKFMVDSIIKDMRIIIDMHDSNGFKDNHQIYSRFRLLFNDLSILNGINFLGSLISENKKVKK